MWQRHRLKHDRDIGRDMAQGETWHREKHGTDKDIGREINRDTEQAET